MDSVDTEAQRIGAVNTIVHEGSQLKGYNTDGKGAIRAITEAYGPLSGADVVLLGAGGAARAISYHLCMDAGRIRVYNRTEEKSRRLVDYLSGLPECSAAIHVGDYERLEEGLGDANILINATPVGMYPNVERSPVDQRSLSPRLLVFDTVYNPLETRLIKDAQTAGADTLSGLSMLVYQGVSAFKLWTGIDPPEKLMYEVAEAKLRDGR